jgi:hypothetical protein
LTGQDKVGTRSPEMPSEHEFRIGYVDAVRMRCVKMKNGRTNAVAALSRGPISHFELPAAGRPSSANNQPALVQACAASPFSLGPNAQRD